MIIPTIKSLTHNAPTQMLKVVCRDGVLTSAVIQRAFPTIAIKVGKILIEHSTITLVIELLSESPCRVVQLFILLLVSSTWKFQMILC